jgi:type II secretory pathway component PulF
MKLFHARYAQRQNKAVKVYEEDFYLPDARSVRRQLRNRGYWPISIREQKPPMLEWMDVRTRNWQVQLLRALRFQSATTSAGTALLNIIEGETDARRRMAFLPTRTVLKGGGSFSDAIKALRLMDAPTMAIIVAGERAGDLKGVIQHAIEHTDEKGKNLKAIIAALSWLSFDIVNVVGTIWTTQFAGIPYLKDQGSKATDPAAIARFNTAITRATWLNGTLLVTSMLAITAAIVFTGLYWFNRQKPDHFTARFMMKVPIVSSYLRNTSLQDTCKLMRRLLEGKVPLADALAIIIDSTFEPATRQYWSKSRERIMAGGDPKRALCRFPLNGGECNQIAAIQSVDQLAEVYGSIAEERELMAKNDRRRLAQSGIMITMFFFGATVIMAIYLLMIQNEGVLNNLNEMKQ